MLWDAETLKPLARLEGHTGPVYSVTFSSNGKTLASGAVDRTVRLWDLDSTAARTLARARASTGFGWGTAAGSPPRHCGPMAASSPLPPPGPTVRPR